MSELVVSGLVIRPEAPAAAHVLWARACAGLEPMEACFGPEGRDPRPRPGETYWTAWQPGEPGAVGLIWCTRPAPTTATFGLGLFVAWRGKGLGVALRDAALALCFADPVVVKAETSIYLSNSRSMGVLHHRHGRMAEEGCQRQTISVAGGYYDRLLVGLTRDEWQAQEGRSDG